MSEQNIINANAASELNPDWGFEIQDTLQESDYEPDSGAGHSRDVGGGGRAFSLGWANRPMAQRKLLEQWANQYRHDFFTYYDIDLGRYYSGKFKGGLQATRGEGNDQYTMTAIFKERKGLPLYSYPGENSLLTTAQQWLDFGFFLEDRNGLGQDLVKLTGAWTYEVFATAHGGARYFTNILDATAEWEYFGYGFRVWGTKNNNLGNIEISLDGTVLTTVDLYSSAFISVAPIYAKVDVPLGIHRVKTRCPHTKNASSSNYYIQADALEVIR